MEKSVKELWEVHVLRPDDPQWYVVGKPLPSRDKAIAQATKHSNRTTGYKYRIRRVK